MSEAQTPQGEPDKAKGPNLREQVKPLTVQFSYGVARAVGQRVVDWLLEITGVK